MATAGWLAPYKPSCWREMALSARRFVASRNGSAGTPMLTTPSWRRPAKADGTPRGTPGLGSVFASAHYQQAATLIKRNTQIGRVWNEIERVRRELGLPERCELVLMDATFGYKVR